MRRTKTYLWATQNKSSKRRSSKSDTRLKRLPIWSSIHLSLKNLLRSKMLCRYRRHNRTQRRKLRKPIILSKTFLEMGIDTYLMLSIKISSFINVRTKSILDAKVYGSCISHLLRRFLPVKGRCIDHIPSHTRTMLSTKQKNKKLKNLKRSSTSQSRKNLKTSLYLCLKKHQLSTTLK